MKVAEKNEINSILLIINTFIKYNNILLFTKILKSKDFVKFNFNYLYKYICDLQCFTSGIFNILYYIVLFILFRYLVIIFCIILWVKFMIGCVSRVLSLQG